MSSMIDENGITTPVRMRGEKKMTVDEFNKECEKMARRDKTSFIGKRVKDMSTAERYDAYCDIYKLPLKERIILRIIYNGIWVYALFFFLMAVFVLSVITFISIMVMRLFQLCL